MCGRVPLAAGFFHRMRRVRNLVTSGYECAVIYARNELATGQETHQKVFMKIANAH